MPIVDLNLQSLIELMAENGARKFYAKPLAENDNSKNQIYLGSDFSVLNILPVGDIFSDTRGESTNFKAAMNFFWITDEHKISNAPGAQLILYPQYPEVRFSGFLRGSRGAPSHLLRERLVGRVLFLGICDDRRVIGYVDISDSGLVKELKSLGELKSQGVFSEIPYVGLNKVVDTRVQLLTELGRIHRLNWIDSKRFTTQGNFIDCLSSNCGGFTLEAELGIIPNSNAEPDYLGWEIKQHASRTLEKFDNGGAITLMTPDPSAGYYAEHGVADFLLKFGYADKRGRSDRINFGGIHIAGKRHPSTGLTLTLIGYDGDSNTITDASGGIYLVADSGQLAAGWSFSKILVHWNRKHNQAAYVPSMMRKTPRQQYRYGSIIRLGENTNALLFLSAVNSGKIYFDPGIKLENVSTHPKSKSRSQFRIHPRNLNALYTNMVDESVI